MCQLEFSGSLAPIFCIFMETFLYQVNSGLQELLLRLVILAQLGNTVLVVRQHQVLASAQQAAIAKLAARRQRV